MSSEIFYDKAFIRVEEKYIPVVNHGSSNCFEFDSRGREIPEKTWSVLNHPYMERMLFTADEIREIADFYEEISMSNRGGTKKSRNRSFEENEFRRWIDVYKRQNYRRGAHEEKDFCAHTDFDTHRNIGFFRIPNL